MSILAKLFSSRVRAEIFRLLFKRNRPSIHLRDLQRRTGASIGAIQKEILRLKELDLLVSVRDGNRLYFSANFEHPLYSVICNLVEKTSGVVEQLREGLMQIQGIDCAFIFGSIASGAEKAQSDIDVMIIGAVKLRTLSSKLKTVSLQVEREINPHIYSHASWREKLKKKDHFVTSVNNGKKIFLVGDQNVLN